VRVQYGASTCYEYTYDRPSSTYKQCKLRVDRTGYCIDRQSASRRFSPWCLLSSAQDVCSTSTSPAMTRSEGHPALRLVCRVSCVVHRVSCIVHRVSCIVYRVSCIVYGASSHNPTNKPQHDATRPPYYNSPATDPQLGSYAYSHSVSSPPRPRLVPSSPPTGTHPPLSQWISTPRPSTPQRRPP
jgi:hypothetical protein